MVIMILSAKEWDVIVVGYEAIVHSVVLVRAGYGADSTVEVFMVTS